MSHRTAGTCPAAARLCRHGRTAAEHGNEVPDAGPDQDHVPVGGGTQEGDGNPDAHQQAPEVAQPDSAAAGAAVAAVPAVQFDVFDCK